MNDLFAVSGRDTSHKDASCEACGSIILKYKIERLVKHVEVCNKINKRSKEALKQQLRGIDDDPHVLVNQNAVDTAVTKLVAVNALPLSVVDSPEFRKLCKLLDPTAKILTRKTLTQKILPGLAVKSMSRLKKQIKSSPDYSLTLEFDGWTSRAGENLLGIIVTLPNGASVLLDLVNISGEHHTGAVIANIALKSIQASGIKKTRFNCIVTDEAANMKLARNKIKAELKTSIIEYRCLAHVFNLIGATLSNIREPKQIMNKLVIFVSKITRHKFLVAKLKEKEAKKIVSAVPTRWYSNCASINSIIDIKDFLERIPRTD